MTRSLYTCILARKDPREDEPADQIDRRLEQKTWVIAWINVLDRRCKHFLLYENFEKDSEIEFQDADTDTDTQMR